jgi:hypothetical protein
MGKLSHLGLHLVREAVPGVLVVSQELTELVPRLCRLGCLLLLDRLGKEVSVGRLLHDVPPEDALLVVSPGLAAHRDGNSFRVSVDLLLLLLLLVVVVAYVAMSMAGDRVLSVCRACRAEHRVGWWK